MSGNENECDPRERPGVHKFIRFVIDNQGGEIGRTVAPCVASKSGHSSGRAWDWMIRADVPDQRARADELIDWLLANDAEIFRRAGLSYIIWDRKVFSAFRPRWRPYDGFDETGSCPSPPCRSPHIDHVHFSWNVPGADGKTSFYNWLGGDQPELAEPEPGNGDEPVALQQASVQSMPGWGGALFGFAFGAIVGILGPRTKLWRRIQGRRKRRRRRV